MTLDNKCIELDFTGTKHIGIAGSKNRPPCVNGCGTSMYFCKVHEEFYCTNCIGDHNQSYLIRGDLH